MGKENMTIREVSEYFNISQATVRNWIRLGKLCLKDNGDKKYISFEEVKRITNDIEKTHKLTSRRNKSKNSSKYIPRKYISSASPNMKTIIRLLEFAKGKNIPIDEVIDYYAKSFMTQLSLPAFVVNALSITNNNTCDHAYDFSEFPLIFISSEDTLGFIYISLRRLQDKKATGSYYTPFFAVDLLLSFLPDEKKSICDPACGTGNFLLRLPDSYPLEFIHGLDIDEMAVKIARINVALKYKVSTEKQLKTITDNIITADYLLGDEIYGKTDYIIGNPPWGSIFSKDQLTALKEKYECAIGSGKPESFDLFIEKAIKNMHSEGSVIFLLPEALLGAEYHQKIRHVIEKNAHISAIIYLGEIFDNVQCPCIILKITGKPTSKIVVRHFKKTAGEELNLCSSYEASSERINEKNFHILSGNEAYKITEKILSVPHFTLENQADFALGIVTGSNKEFLSDKKLSGYEEILKGSDINKYYCNTPKNYIKFTPEKFQQVAPISVYRAKEKLFYRFIANEPVFSYDTKGTLSLNSANILIPKVPGYSALYIMAVLNSDVMSFYYRNTFRNMKVLRSAIEKLPIAYCNEATMKSIEELAYEISENTTDRAMGIREINEKIRRLYGVSEDDIM